VDPGDHAEIELAVECGSSSSLREPPSAALAQHIGIDRDQEQPGLARKMLPAVSATCEAAK
jgi:hypothetical protein